MTCQYQYDDGVYVLGALSPGERAEFEQHLAACAACTAAVRELAPLPGLLGRVDPQVAERDLPDSSRLPRLLEAVLDSRRRRARARRRRLVAVTAAAAVAAAAAGAGAAVWTGFPDAGEPPPVAGPPMEEHMDAVLAWTPVTAQVRLTDQPAGTGVEMRCQYAADYSGSPQTFRLVAVGADGSDEQVSSWRAGPGDKVELAGLTRFTDRQLVRIELRDEIGTPLLVHEP